MTNSVYYNHVILLPVVDSEDFEDKEETALKDTKCKLA